MLSDTKRIPSYNHKEMACSDVHVITFFPQLENTLKDLTVNGSHLDPGDNRLVAKAIYDYFNRTGRQSQYTIILTCSIFPKQIINASIPFRNQSGNTR